MADISLLSVLTGSPCLHFELPLEIWALNCLSGLLDSTHGGVLAWIAQGVLQIIDVRGYGVLARPKQQILQSAGISLS